MKHLQVLRRAISKKSRFLIICTAAVICLQFSFDQRPADSKLEKYYFAQLTGFEQQLVDFEKRLGENSSRQSLQQSFLQLRLAYKKLAVFTEFFNAYETKMLNRPALPSIIEDDPKHIIQPRGLQVVEEYLYDTSIPVPYVELKTEITKMLAVVLPLHNETGLSNKFSNELVFEALQSSLIRLMTLGISGFDSPIALLSIPEAASTLESVQTITGFYKKESQQKAPGHYDKMNTLFTIAIQYLRKNKDFNSFDRLFFIKKYISPAYTLLVEIRIKNGWMLPGDRKPIDPASTSLFAKNTFNINAFSIIERYRPTAERIELGRRLFYDPILSTGGKRSCATCHKPELAFTDGLKTALAVDEKTYLLRNTPTMWNSALQTKQFFDARVSLLENQLHDVIHNQEEMKGSLNESVSALQNHPQYAELFAKAYPLESVKVTPYNVSNAVASYIRSLVALNSRFDQYMRGDEKKMTTEEKAGFNLFMGKAKCGTCHFMPLFNGLVPPEFNDTESEIIGVPASKDTVAPKLDSDRGRIGFTRAAIHEFSFKTPTLRNIALTAPYMHNGVFDSLEEVMAFYNKGGGTGLGIDPEYQTLPPDKLNLTKKEISSVIAFMRTLTDTSSAKR